MEMWNVRSTAAVIVTSLVVLTATAAEVQFLSGLTLIDGTGTAPVPGTTIVIDDGCIRDVGLDGTIAIPEGAHVEDLAGHFVIPGLIDMHAHAVVPTCLIPGDVDRPLSEAMLRTLLQFGITTARSPSSPTELGVTLRDAIAAGQLVGPRLFVAGQLLNGARTTASQVREQVRDQAKHGVDFIKLYVSLSPGTVRTAIREAHSLALPVIGHLQRTTWTEAIEMGIDSITHVTSWSDELLPAHNRRGYREAQDDSNWIHARIDWLELFDPNAPEVDAMIALLVEHGIAVDPTLVVFDTKFSADDSGDHPYSSKYRANRYRDVIPGLRTIWEECRGHTDDWTRDDFNRVREVWPRLLALVRRYHDGGVMLTAGSDVTNPWVIPGESLHQELELLVEAGIPPAEVLTIATRNGALALGVLHETGTIEVSKRADLVVLRSNPLVDIANTRDIQWIMKAGARYEPIAAPQRPRESEGDDTPKPPRCGSPPSGE